MASDTEYRENSDKACFHDSIYTMPLPNAQLQPCAAQHLRSIVRIHGGLEACVTSTTRCRERLPALRNAGRLLQLGVLDPIGDLLGNRMRQGPGRPCPLREESGPNRLL